MKSTYITLLAFWFNVSTPFTAMIRRLKGNPAPYYLVKHGDYFELED